MFKTESRISRAAHRAARQCRARKKSNCEAFANFDRAIQALFKTKPRIGRRRPPDQGLPGARAEIRIHAPPQLK
jgi:hypothetical protein